MKCWECGKEFLWNDDYSRAYCSPECRAAAEERAAEIKENYHTYKFLHMLETAMRNLETKVPDYSKYKPAVERIRQTGVVNPAMFDSSDEVLACMILWANGFSKAKPQYKIGTYRVDFFCESQKTIVEIDGDDHKNKLLYDSNRDKKLREMLGAQWEVVRIPTGLLRKNPAKLIEAIRESRRAKVKVRKENGGIIPAYYSKQSKAEYEEIVRKITK